MESLKWILKFDLSRANLLTVCDAFLTGGLSAVDLEYIAFALIASDGFSRDGDEDNILAEIINDWVAPEINYPLNVENIQRCRRWLEGAKEHPGRPGQLRDNVRDANSKSRSLTPLATAPASSG